jgi:hypothetical protein
MLLKMKIELKNLEIGNKVWCGGESGFCWNRIEEIKEIEWKFDKDTGKKYKIIVLNEGRKFDSRSGRAITSPIAYYLEETEQ